MLKATEIPRTETIVLVVRYVGVIEVLHVVQELSTLST